MKKKLLAILLCFAMIAGMLSVTVFAAGTGHANHCVCGGTLAIDGHTHTSYVMWTGVSSLDEITRKGYYYLKNDVEVTGTYEPADGVVICLNGNDIICKPDKNNGEYSTVIINKDVTFTVTDCAADAGRITHDTGKSGRGVENSGTFIMYGGRISGNSTQYSGGGVHNGKNSVFTMYGGIIGGTAEGDKNTARNGGGVYNEKATFNMKNGSISGNEAEEAGGGVYNTGSDFTMENGAISGNKTTTTSTYNGFGGGVYNDYSMDYTTSDATVVNGNFRIMGGTVSQNTTGHSGGGVYNKSLFTLDGGTIKGNAVTAQKGGNAGGGVYVSGLDAEFRMNGGVIGGNDSGDANSARTGGGIYVSSNKYSGILGGSVEGNKSSENGGGIYNSGDIIVYNATVAGNEVTGEGYCGGGIYNNGKLFLKNTVITGNKVQNGEDSYGGGLYAAGTTTSIQGNTVIKNNINGGNAYVAAAAALTAIDIGEEACIKISGTAEQTVVSGSTDTAVFATDSDDYELVKSGSDLKLIEGTDKTHRHCVCTLDTAVEEAHIHNADTEWVGITSLDQIDPDHAHYYLKNDVVITDSWKPASGNVLCLNGHSIICDASAATISMNANNTLTLTDCSANETGEITHAYGRTGRGINNDRADIALWRGNISGNTTSSYGAGVIVGKDAYFSMYGGSVKNNSTSNYGLGGGIYNRGTVNMFGGTVSDNYAAGSGGGIYSYRGTVTMFDGADISNNRTDPENKSAYGGGLNNYLGIVIMSGGTISGNSSNCGGGVYNGADSGSSAETISASFAMNGGTICGNEAEISGGGIYNSAGKDAEVSVTLTGSSVISYNKAQNGGGVGNYGGGVTLTMEGNVEIKNNTAESDDSARGNGGGVYNTGSGYSGYPVFEQKGGTISDNTANRGGGIYVDRGKWNAAGGTVTGNTGNISGGVHMNSSGTVTLSGNVNVTGNRLYSDLSLNNICLISSSLKITDAGLTDGARVGITPPIGVTVPMTITGNTVTSNYFVSDDDAYETAIDSDGYVVLREKTEAPESFTVKINLPANDSARRYGNTGQLVQVVGKGDRYNPIRLNTVSTHYFSNSDIKKLNAALDGSGIYVATVSESMSLVITGSPTKDIEATVTTTAKRVHSKPVVWGEAPNTADDPGYIRVRDANYALEYRIQGTEEWHNFGYMIYCAVEPGHTYEVRYKGTITDLVSPISTCYVSVYTPPVVVVPVPEPNEYVYDGNEHTGVTLGSDYIVHSGTNKATDAENYLVYIKPAEGKQWIDGTRNEKAILWTIKKAPQEAPTGLTPQKPTVLGESDGSITGVTFNMEYRKAGDAEWIVCTGSRITGLAAGVYEIRYKETKNYEAGAVAVITVPEGNAPTYRVVEGANGSWTENSDGSLAFRADGAVSKFTGIKVDGVTVASDRYTVGTDVTVITLKNEYLAGLSVGTHTLTVVYRDGECIADFEVLAAPHTHDYGNEWKHDETEHWHECTCGDKEDKEAHSFDWKVDKAATADETGLKHEECAVCGAKRNENTVIEKLPGGNDGDTGNTGDNTGDNTGSGDSTGNNTGNTGNTGSGSPKTGDSSNALLWIILLFVSGGVVTAAAVASRKKKRSR